MLFTNRRGNGTREMAQVALRKHQNYVAIHLFPGDAVVSSGMVTAADAP